MEIKDQKKKSRLAIFQFFILFLMVWSPNGFASSRAVDPLDACNNCYYVDGVNGSDSNPGTQALPWKTIQKAANTMVAGETTIILSGTYHERVKVSRSGSSGTPITYQAEGTVVMQGFTIEANFIQILGFEITDTPDDSQDGWGIFVEGSNCLIEGNYVHFATRGGIKIWARSGNEQNTNHCTVRNNRLYRNSQSGIEVYGRDNVIDGNEIWGTIQYHPKWINPPSWVDADGIRFFGSGHIIRDNFIHDIKYSVPENVNPHIDCFQTFSNTDHELAQDILIEKNICKNVQAQTSSEFGKGFMVEDANHLLIRNNIIEAFSNAHINGSADITIINNIFTSSLTLDMGFDTAGVTLTKSINTFVKNNIFFDLPNHIVYLQDDTSKQGLDIGYNCVYRSDGKLPWGSPYPHDLWQVNPIFINPGSDDFHLSPISPVIDRGITQAYVVDDYDGNPRPQGLGYDIGIYELASSTIYSTWLPLIASR